MSARPKAEQQVQDRDVVLYRCWQNGRTPKATVLNLKKFCGCDVSQEWVRSRFANFSRGLS